MTAAGAGPRWLPLFAVAVVAALAVGWRGGYGQNSHSGVVAMAACAAGGG